MIFYFTGTGNSRFAADLLAQKLSDQVVSLNQVFREKQPLTFSSQSPFVVVSPIYAWRLPKPVEDFLSQAEFTGSSKLYLVATMGASCGGAGAYAQQKLAGKSIDYMGLTGIVMPDNYLISFQMPSQQEALSILRAALPTLDQIAQTIAAEKPFPQPSAKILGKLLSGAVNWGFSHFMASSKSFTVSQDCIHCGQCAANCPTGNIVLREGKVEFGDRCAFCLGCIHRCPVHAIDYKGKGKKHGYYLCPPKDLILSPIEKE